MTKKAIITELRKLGYKANYKNVLISTLEVFGYVLIIQRGKIKKVFLKID